MTKTCNEKTIMTDHKGELSCQKSVGHKGMHEHVISFRWGDLTQFKATYEKEKGAKL